MPQLDQTGKLKKELSLLDLFNIGTGATIASGFFLLPGIAAASAGAAMPLSFVLAALLLLPGIISQTELSTAMPRAGGIYYFLDRSLGPLMGTVGGFGTWVALCLKSAFALIGVGAYLGLFLPDVPIQPIAAAFAILFGVINLFGAKKTGSAQVFLVLGLLLLLLWFTGVGISQVNLSHFTGLFAKGGEGIIAATGLVIVSYMGLTKVSSVAEEVKDPERNIPRGTFMALGTAVLVYLLGTSMMVGVMSADKLAGDLTPVATVAEALVGKWGVVAMTVAAVLAFSSGANAGILSASRFPLAMSRDHLLPRVFSNLGKRKTPSSAIYLTVAFILLFVTVFDPTKIAKIASAFKLFMFALSCLAVIVMRESHIDSYDPGYRGPFYPWMQIAGIIFPIIFISQMGWLPILLTVGLTVLGIVWYFVYAQDKVIRDGAIYHIFARLGERRFEGLDRELRSILKEKGLRESDPFDALVASAKVIDLRTDTTFEEIVQRASEHLAKQFKKKPEILVAEFMRGTRVGATPVAHGAALPHLRLDGIKHSELVVVRSLSGVLVEIDDEFAGEYASTHPVFALFFLVSPTDNPGQHLRFLAQIAGRVDDDHFLQPWLHARNEQEIKELLLRDGHHMALTLGSDTPAAEWIGKMIADIELPEGCLIALVHRTDEVLIPRVRMILEEGDRLTVIGHPKGIEQLYRLYGS